MSKLGTSKQPAVVRVQTQARSDEILLVCQEHGWMVIVGIEPDQPEDIADYERLLHPPEPVTIGTKVGRNDACPCGSGQKYKWCCGRARE